MNQEDQKITCPDCGSEINKVEGMITGDILECVECGTEVEITSTDPLTYRELVEEK
jgi:lysine biosynthesis protein LysW